MSRDGWEEVRTTCGRVACRLEDEYLSANLLAEKVEQASGSGVYFFSQLFSIAIHAV